MPEILKALAAPMTVDELLADLTATYDLVDPDRNALAERLVELAAVGLVSSA